MSMKKILMAAVAVTALTAGSASAITINATAAATVATVGGATPITSAAFFGGSVVGTATKTLYPSVLGLAAGMTVDPLTIASETQLTATTSTSAVLRANTTDAGLLAGKNYVVTYRITGGTFATAGITSANAKVISSVAAATAAYNAAYAASAGANAAAKTVDALAAVTATNGTVTSIGTVSPTTVQFAFTTGNSNAVGIEFTTAGIIPGADKGPVSVTVEVSPDTNQALLLDGGQSLPVTIVDFRPGLAFKVTTANALTASIASGFKKFGTAAAGAASDATSAKLGENIGFALAGPAISSVTDGDNVFNLDGSALTVANAVTAATLTITGSLAGFDAKVGSLTTAQIADATTGVVPLLNTTNLGLLTSKTLAVVLQQKATPVNGVEATYTIKPTDVVLAAGLLPGSYSAKALGTVAYEGTNFYAAWISDGASAAGFKNIIRLGNRSATAIASVKASLINPLVTGTTGTVASTATCEVGPLPASGELLIKSETLTACFGKFGRSDVRLTIQGNASDMVAKLRVISPDGSAADTALGTGVADAAQ